jgi:phosphate/phosphite/phosphonate ABC transporter binding protein
MKKIIVRAALVTVLATVFVIGIAWFSKNPPTEKNGEYEYKEKLGIGITTGEKEAIERYQAFVDYLNKYSGLEWELVPLKEYGSFITLMSLGQIKAGFMGSAVAYTMITENIVLPVVRGEKDGISDYYGYIFTRKDSGLNKIEDLKDKKFAYVDPYTSAGYLFPVYLLKTAGYEPEDFFKASSFLGSHEKAILAVFDGEFDGGAAKNFA